MSLEGISHLKSRILTVPSFFCLIFLYAPIALIVTSSFFSSHYLEAWQPFSYAWYAAAFANEAIMDGAKTSLLIAVFTSALATCLGTLVALALYRFRLRGSRLVFGVLLLPIVLPEIVMGIGLLLFFSSLARPLFLDLFGVTIGSLPSVVAGHVGFCLSYVVILVGARFGTLDPRLEEAALDLGATPWQVVCSVSLPQCWPAIVSAALLAFTLSLDDFYVSYFASAGGSGFRTLPIQLYAMQTRSGVTPEMNAISTLFLCISMGLMSLAFFINRKSFVRGKS